MLLKDDLLPRGGTKDPVMNHDLYYQSQLPWLMFASSVASLVTVLT